MPRVVCPAWLRVALCDWMAMPPWADCLAWTSAVLGVSLATIAWDHSS